MGKPYSVDLRKQIIGFVEGGRSRRDAADHFEVSASCAIELMDGWNQTGSAAPGKRGGSIGKLTPHKDFLLAGVKEKADITMPELAAVLKAETSTEAAPRACPLSDPAWAAIQKKHCWQAKKSPDVASRRDEWIRLRQPRMCLEPHRLAFIDETGTTTKMTRLRGRAPLGERLRMHVPFGIGTPRLLLALLDATVLQHPGCWTDDERPPLRSMSRHSSPTLSKGDVVVMDNLSSTKDRV